MAIPELTYGCNSWIVVKRGTNEAVLETFQRSVAEKVNTDKYEVKTAYQHLCDLNQSIANT